MLRIKFMDIIKIYGCIKPKIKINDFVTVIFSDNNKNFYIQKYNNSKYEYKTINIIESSFITEFDILDEQINFNNQILGFLDEKNKLIIGNRKSVIKKLLPILTNDSIYPFQRYLIAKRLNISFMARKLLYDSIEYFDTIEFPIDLTYEKYYEDFLLITLRNAIQQENDKLISKLKESLKEIKKEMDKYGFKWNDYFNPNEYPLRIDKYKISEKAIWELHDLLKPIGLFEFISNPYISLEIDNSFNFRYVYDIEPQILQNDNETDNNYEKEQSVEKIREQLLESAQR